jgi:hypothetical protein
LSGLTTTPVTVTVVPGPYGGKEASFYATKAIWSPIVITRDVASGELSVENRYDFTDTRQCEFVWQLRRFHSPDEAQSGFDIIAEKKLDAARARAGCTTEGPPARDSATARRATPICDAEHASVKVKERAQASGGEAWRRAAPPGRAPWRGVAFPG